MLTRRYKRLTIMVCNIPVQSCIKSSQTFCLVVRLQLTLFWYIPCCFWDTNQNIIKLYSLTSHLRIQDFIKRGLPLAHTWQGAQFWPVFAFLWAADGEGRVREGGMQPLNLPLPPFPLWICQWIFIKAKSFAASQLHVGKGLATFHKIIHNIVA